MDDPYEVLGVARDVSPEDLKRAYRLRARELHPDRNKAPDAADRFKRLVAAWEVLQSAHERRRWHAEHDPGARGIPHRFLEDFTDALERAEALVFGAVLPRVLSGWRGAGVEAAIRLANAAVEGGLDEIARGPKAGWRGRRRAARFVASWVVNVEYGPAFRHISTHRVYGGRIWEVAFAPRVYWEAGVHEPEALDEAVARDLATVAAALITAPSGYGGRLVGPQSLVMARARDDEAVRTRLLAFALWGTVALAAAVMIGTALYQSTRVP